MVSVSVGMLSVVKVVFILFSCFIFGDWKYFLDQRKTCEMIVTADDDNIKDECVEFWYGMMFYVIVALAKFFILSLSFVDRRVLVDFGIVNENVFFVFRFFCSRNAEKEK